MQKMHVSCHPAINSMTLLFLDSWRMAPDERMCFQDCSASGNNILHPKHGKPAPAHRQDKKHIHTSALRCCRGGNSFLLCRHECAYSHQRMWYTLPDLYISLWAEILMDSSIQRNSPHTSHSICNEEHHSVLEAWSLQLLCVKDIQNLWCSLCEWSRF